MAKSEGSTTLLPEPFEVRKEAVDKAAPAARAAAERISQAYRRRVSGPAEAAEPGPSDGPSDETPPAE
jgi:hypothetical protein